MEKTDNMQNAEAVFTQKGTNPLLTVLLFGTIVTGVVASGSYFSKQNMAAREVEEGLRIPLSAFATLGH